MTEVRCGAKMHGRIVGGLLEIKCDSRFCKGFGPGVVVLHYFDPCTGIMKDTKRYRDPVASKGNEVKA